eukprot:m51a1_g6084 hypothetical protein (621) ;mRNA; f:10279-13380
MQTTPEKAGYLFVSQVSWSQQWFVVSQPSAMMQLQTCVIQEDPSNPQCFRVVDTTGQQQAWLLAASTPEDKGEWVQALRANTGAAGADGSDEAMSAMTPPPVPASSAPPVPSFPAPPAPPPGLPPPPPPAGPSAATAAAAAAAGGAPRAPPASGTGITVIPPPGSIGSVSSVGSMGSVNSGTGLASMGMGAVGLPQLPSPQPQGVGLVGMGAMGNMGGMGGMGGINPMGGMAGSMGMGMGVGVGGMGGMGGIGNMGSMGGINPMGGMGGMAGMGGINPMGGMAGNMGFGGVGMLSLPSGLGSFGVAPPPSSPGGAGAPQMLPSVSAMAQGQPDFLMYGQQQTPQQQQLYQQQQQALQLQQLQQQQQQQQQMMLMAQQQQLQQQQQQTKAQYVSINTPARPSVQPVPPATFWSSAFGNQEQVTWAQFLAAYQSFLQVGNIPPEFQTALYSVLNVISENTLKIRGVVSRPYFCLFLNLFGPITECADKCYELYQSGVFHGELSSAESEAIINAAGKKVGMYLLRLRKGARHQLALAFVDRGNVIKHTLISVDPNTNRYFLAAGADNFRTLGHMLAAYAQKFSIPLRSSALQNCATGPSSYGSSPVGSRGSMSSQFDPWTATQ